MSWTDEEIDKLVQESAAAQQVEYKDAYWKEMEVMLNQKSSKKIGFWWWISGCVLLLVGVGTYFTMNSTSNGSIKEMSNNYVASTSDLEEPVILNSENTTEDLSKENETEKESAEYISTKALQKNQSVEVSSKTIEMKVSNNLNSIGTNKRNTESNLGNERLLAMSETESSLEESSQTIKTSFESNKELFSYNEKDISPVALNEESVDLMIDGLSVKPWQNIINTQFEPVTGELKVFPRTRLGFYVGINGGVGQSYLVTKTNNDMYQLGIDAGVEYFRGPWSFGAGIGLKQQITRNLELKDRRSYYSFGLINVNSNLSYDQLIFADVNLNVNYSFGKSSVGVAVTPNYLLGARLSYDQITQETIGYETQTIDKTSVNHKYVSSKNFKQFGLNAGITYSYALPKNYLIQAEVNTRIVDKLLNSNFDGRASKLPLMLELGIKKRF